MHTKTPVEIDASKGFEQSDLPMRDVKIGLTFMIIFTLIMGALTPLIMKALGAQVGTPKEAEHYELRTIPVSPAPLLQDSSTNQTDTINLRRKEHERMTTEGIDTQTGKRHIPIDQALAEEAAKAGR